MTDYQRDLVPASTALPAQDPYGRASAVLGPDDALLSATRNMRLVLQSDGNLVLNVVDDLRTAEEIPHAGYHAVVWASGTNGTGTIRCEMQDDGNLVLYDSSGGATWATNTAGNPGAFLRCQDDGNLLLFRNDGAVLWTSNTFAGNRGGDSGTKIDVPKKKPTPGPALISVPGVWDPSGAFVTWVLNWPPLGTVADGTHLKAVNAFDTVTFLKPGKKCSDADAGVSATKLTDFTAILGSVHPSLPISMSLCSSNPKYYNKVTHEAFPLNATVEILP